MTRLQERARWNERYRTEGQPRSVNPRLVTHAALLTPGRALDLAGGTGHNGAWLATWSDAFRVIDADVSDQAVSLAPVALARVIADAGALPFPPHSFDTILNIRFYDSRILFTDLLRAGGTVFFETYTPPDAKYRPAFNPAHRFPLDEIPRVFQGLEILYRHEQDDGKFVFVTVIARKPL